MNICDVNRARSELAKIASAADLPADDCRQASGVAERVAVLFSPGPQLCGDGTLDKGPPSQHAICAILFGPKKAWTEQQARAAEALFNACATGQTATLEGAPDFLAAKQAIVSGLEGGLQAGEIIEPVYARAIEQIDRLTWVLLESRGRMTEAVVELIISESASPTSTRKQAALVVAWTTFHYDFGPVGVRDSKALVLVDQFEKLAAGIIRNTSALQALSGCSAEEAKVLPDVARLFEKPNLESDYVSLQENLMRNGHRRTLRDVIGLDFVRSPELVDLITDVHQCFVRVQLAQRGVALTPGGSIYVTDAFEPLEIGYVLNFGRHGQCHSNTPPRAYNGQANGAENQLSSQGVEQAHRLARSAWTRHILGQVMPDGFYVSPLGRCASTRAEYTGTANPYLALWERYLEFRKGRVAHADALRQAAEIMEDPVEWSRRQQGVVDRMINRSVVTVLPLLSELNFGALDGKELRTIAPSHRSHRFYRQHDAGYLFENGETFAQMALLRARLVLTLLNARHGELIEGRRQEVTVIAHSVFGQGINLWLGRLAEYTADKTRRLEDGRWPRTIDGHGFSYAEFTELSPNDSNVHASVPQHARS